MKKMIFILVVLIIILNSYSLPINLSDLDLSKIESEKIDLTKIKVSYVDYNWYYITDIVYYKDIYHALIEYDGNKTLEIKAINEIDTKLNIDFKNLNTKIINNNIYFENITVDNKNYTLELRIKDKNKLTISNTSFIEKEIDQQLTYTPVTCNFEDGKSVHGNWKTEDGNLIQTDINQYYAKYIIDLEQKTNEICYEFTAKAIGSGWVGYGLHFYANGSESGIGYGYGESYLVWFTRDPDFNQTDKTFVQLYRSVNDSKMILVASQMISRKIEKFLDVEIYLNYNLNQIAVIVDRDLEIAFSLNEKISIEGKKIGFRTLGAEVIFSDLKVRVR